MAIETLTSVVPKRTSFEDGIKGWLAALVTSLNTMLVELYKSETVIQTDAPLTGTTVVCTDADSDLHLVLTPAGTLAALTITLPTNANSRVGQKVSISSSAILTSLTISGSGLTIANAPTTFASVVTAYCTLQKVASGAWRRIG